MFSFNANECTDMEVKELEKKGHRTFAMAAKSFSFSEQQKRSKSWCIQSFLSAAPEFFGYAGKNAHNVISRFLSGSYLGCLC
jgi:hypothetical protein